MAGPAAPTVLAQGVIVRISAAKDRNRGRTWVKFSRALRSAQGNRRRCKAKSPIWVQRQKAGLEIMPSIGAMARRPKTSLREGKRALAIAARVRRVDSGSVPRAEALVGAAALAGSGTAVARKLTLRLRRDVSDPWVKPALGRDDSTVLDGELGVAPRSPVVTALLAITGLLFVASATRHFARVALAVRRPATVRIASGLSSAEARPVSMSPGFTPPAMGIQSLLSPNTPWQLLHLAS